MCFIFLQNFAKTTLSAERGTFYLLSRDNGQLLADVYDEGIEEASTPSYYKKNLKVKLMKEHGFASYVSSTGMTLNIQDAHLDSRFGRYVDERTGFITRSVLCMPVVGLEGILGKSQSKF